MERTFISVDVKAAQNISLAAQQLCGVTGHCMELRGPMEVNIGVGSKEEEMPVYVASIDDPCLFSLDYLKKSRAYLNFGDTTINVYGVRMSLLRW